MYISFQLCASYLRLRTCMRVMLLLESSAEEINHHNVVRLVAVRFGETYFLFLKTSERIATAKATPDERGAQTQR